MRQEEPYLQHVTFAELMEEQARMITVARQTDALVAGYCRIVKQSRSVRLLIPGSLVGRVYQLVYGRIDSVECVFGTLFGCFKVDF